MPRDPEDDRHPADMIGNAMRKAIAENENTNHAFPGCGGVKGAQYTFPAPSEINLETEYVESERVVEPTTVERIEAQPEPVELEYIEPIEVYHAGERSLLTVFSLYLGTCIITALLVFLAAKYGLRLASILLT